MDAEDELATLRRQLAEAQNLASEKQRLLEEEQRLREEEQRLREEEQRRREEEQRRREAAEAIAKPSRPLTLQEYLESCHSLLPITIVTDPTLTTQGPTTSPAGRLYPQRIIPWEDFPVLQGETWATLSTSAPFTSDAVFPSLHQVEHLALLNAPVSGEQELRIYAYVTIEFPVQLLVEAASKHELLRTSLPLDGLVTFQSHINLGKPTNKPTIDSISESMGQSSLAEDGPQNPDLEGPTRVLALALASKPKPKAKGKSGPADQFCVYTKSDGAKTPVVAIEYKPPHKLTWEEVATGLQGEIRPEQDVINKEGSGFEFASKTLAAAVVTQLFSYMVRKGIQYGYVCTGEALAFLYIPDDDPTNVYYHVCVPKIDVRVDDDGALDVQANDNDWFQYTAAAQVFAFTLRALRKEPPSQSWFDKTAKLKTWAVEYDDILRKIPETDRDSPEGTPYKPVRWRRVERSPIMTRSRGDQPANPTMRGDGDDDDDESSPSPSPAPNPAGSSTQTATASPGPGSRRQREGKRERRRSGRQGQRKRGDGWQGQQTQQKIKDRPFCTHMCLRGLAYGGAMDKNCPNFGDHGYKYISQQEFLRLIRTQLAEDRGPEADCTPLYRYGARGALLKVRLSSHGYTLVAKGVEEHDRHYLLYEKKLYDRLRPVQGDHVPVSLGTVDLELPYYFNGGIYECILLMGWAGRPLFECISDANRTHFIEMVTRAFRAIHQLQILQCDAKPRNMLYDEQRDSLMIIDFERAEYLGGQVQQSTNANNQDQNKNHKKGQRTQDAFEGELRSAIRAVSRCQIPRY